VLCVAVDAEGNAVIGAQPTVPKPTWSRPKHIDSKNTMAGVSCAPTSLCVAVDNGGYAVVGHVSAALRPTTGQIKSSLISQITPRATIPAVLAQRGYALTFTSLSGGTLAVDWNYSGRPKPVLVATGRAKFPKASTLKMRIKLTAPGQLLLKHSQRLKLTARATFTPTAGRAVVATETFTLRR
jgi:hypothetical protein